MQRPKRTGAAVEDVVHWLQQHYSDRVTLKSLAAAFNRHPAYFGRMFRRGTGVGLMKYLTRIRMEHAARMILRGDKIEAVALCVGYRSRINFYRHFKQYFGMSPGAYRERGRSTSTRNHARG